MNLLVSNYVVSEHNRGKLAMCNECMFIPTWEVRTQTMENPTKAYSCPEHINEVLFKSATGRYRNE